MQLVDIYERLLEAYGSQSWWPAGRRFNPPEWEIAVGAVLTQNTNWNNVEKALDNLKRSGVTGCEDMLKLKDSKLKELVRPAGFYNQKAERLKSLAAFVSGFGSFEEFARQVTREGLLKIKGIGPETADSILLYACGRPCFVVDTYTRRVFSRLGMLKGGEGYEAIRRMFEKNIPKDVGLYKEFHALIVALAKTVCRKRPDCLKCPLNKDGKDLGFGLDTGISIVADSMPTLVVKQCKTITS